MQAVYPLKFTSKHTVYPILDTRLFSIFPCMFVTLRPLDSETVWTGDFGLKNKKNISFHGFFLEIRFFLGLIGLVYLA